MVYSVIYVTSVVNVCTYVYMHVLYKDLIDAGTFCMGHTNTARTFPGYDVSVVTCYRTSKKLEYDTV
jgi:hypothetical protein